MNFTITVTADDADTLRTNIVMLAASYDKQPSLTDRATAIQDAGQTNEEKPRKLSTAAQATPASTTTEAADDTGQAKPALKISIADVRARLAQLTRDGKSDAVVAALQSFGCARLTDLAPEHYRELLANLGVSHE